MPYLLRKVEKMAWDPISGSLARALEDLGPDQKHVSVFFVEENPSNLDGIVAALAAKRDYRDDLAYILIDEALLIRLDIASEDQPGDTYDPKVNACHRNLIFDSEDQRVRFAQCLLEQCASTPVAEKKKAQVVELIAHSIDEGRFDIDRLKPKLKKRVEPLTRGSIADSV